MGKSHKKAHKESQEKQETDVQKYKLEKREHESCIQEADLDVKQNIETNDTIKQKPKKSKKSRKDNSVGKNSISETQADLDADFLDAKSKTKKKSKQKKNVNCVSSLERVDIADELQFQENNNADRTGENNVQHKTADLELCNEQSEDTRKKKMHKKKKCSVQSIETPCIEEMSVFAKTKRKRSSSEGLEQIQSPEKKILMQSEMPLGDDCSDYKAHRSVSKKKKHSKSEKHQDCSESVEEKDTEQERKVSKKKMKKLKKAKKESDLHVSDNELALIDAPGNEIVCENVEIKKTKHKGLSSKGKMESSAICNNSTYTPRNGKKSRICEVDEMVGKVNSKDKVDHQTDGFGQWNSQMFENSERQNKFLRLLGGFKKSGALGTCTSDSTTNQKKGLFGSLKPTQSQIGGSRAASYQQASDMNSRLETDFTTALSYSLGGQRGKGLGFQPDPAAGKKLYIDVNKCSSKKFDE